MQNTELETQYRTLIREQLTKNRSYGEHYLYLLGAAGGIALEQCYTDTERGKRLRILFQVWEEEWK